MKFVKHASLVLITVMCGVGTSTAGEASAGLPEVRRPIELEARRKPDSDWKTYASTTVDRLLGKRLANFAAPELSKYGGLLSEQYPATGFFRTKQIDSRWWLIDPEGHPQIRMALNAVYRRTRSSAVHALPKEIKAHVTAEGGALWAADTVELLHDLGVNSLGRWSESEVFKKTGHRVPYVTSLHFMASFGESLGVTYEKYGHRGYQDNIIPVFHPDFPAFCDSYAEKRAAPLADDPYLVGHYTDNEMPVPRKLLKVTLNLDPDNDALRPNRDTAWEWFRERRGADAKVDDVTPEDGEAYLGLVYDRYYEVTTAALRRHDPNHLIIGTRLHGAGPKIVPVVAAAGRHIDVISFNTYGYWNVPTDLMAMWGETTGRPFIVSEFCIKGADSGLDNQKGAGWDVRTQHDRGVWYQNFTIGLMQSPHCVGWDYFKYRDDVDVNKGVLTYDFKPHPAFYAAMKQSHETAYRVIQFLDSASSKKGD